MAHMFSHPTLHQILRTVRRLSMAGVFVAIVTPSSAAAQTPQPDPAQDETIRLRMPTVNVTAQKEPADKQRVPVAVTAVPQETIDDAGIRIVSDAAIFAPNVFFTEASARKISNARFRGIGSSPANPGITTYIDGVPQLNANTSSIELLDIEQIEFVRGPQSTLFGRNTLGGVVNITTARPSMSAWTGQVSAPFGNYGGWGVQAGVSGPLVANKLSLGVSATRIDRDGFTVNEITGNDIDSREGFSGKAQLLWLPSAAWEGRLIVTADHAHDGDYALQDIGALRATPYRAMRDFEGTSDREVFGTTAILRRAGNRFAFTSTTAFVDWSTQDVTDLDYTALPMARRDNSENATQFTQEFRIASATSGSGAVQTQWQVGAFLFNNSYEQDAVNAYAPGLFGPIAINEHSPRATLDDTGIGLYGQATFTFNDTFDVAAGLRYDYEDKSGVLETFYEPAIAPAGRRDVGETFSNVSPQVSAAWRVRPDTSIYATVGRGYKAGGFNPASPAGSEGYAEEFTTNVEGGLKTLLAEGRVSLNAAVFAIDWDDLQLNLPNPFVPGQFFIANVGGATSRGFELELGARVAPSVDLFAAFGYAHAEFGEGSTSGGVNVEGNHIPTAPDYTTSAGIQFKRMFGRTGVVARADAVFYGEYFYDDQNTMSQEAYSLVNARFAVTHGHLLGELLVRNAFDTEYIPFALPYPGLATSGFIGEMGAPRVVTAHVGIRF